MLKGIYSFFERLKERFDWVRDVSVHMAADPISKVKLFFGGIWFILNDTWKSRLSFTATVSHFDSQNLFYFDDLSDYGLFCEIFLDNPYSPKKYNNVSTIFDLGANVGVSALYFRLLYPEAHIHSFEPDPSNLKQLKKNAGYLGNMTIYDFAVGGENGEISFYADPHRGSSSSTQKLRDRQLELKVQIKTLATVLDELNIEEIDILKFDIEGSEEKLFANFAGYKKIRHLFGEVHGDLCNAENTIGILKENYSNFHLYPLDIENRWYVTAHN
ncbi:FkbM family methyltransferase [Balneolaceae bacterium YR4-1]|uniref:FkbM family methyltransferase n=1 Tax=Halalkalibaculum roseum TaxID=2709311 RepID=A0A6M1T1Z7_9BACT|nr:FkbM family methyltransferase [Halalkalibaculum roseum]NGP76787.1 FkbM family methyltransferase [Halalkalibaculum roseum]